MELFRMGIDRAPVRNIIEPVAWARKYFTPASASWLELLDVIIGINESMLISRASQMVSQFLADTANRVLRRSEEKKIKETGIENSIKERGSRTP